MIAKYLLLSFLDQKIKSVATSPNPDPIDRSISLQSTLTEEQITAITGGLFYDVSIITGGAGTGKTSIIAELAHRLKLKKETFAMSLSRVKLFSRLQEVLKCRLAMTMDRMIINKKGATFDVLIIDEASMVTTELFDRFIRTFTHPYRIVIVGDINQLQPIGWGTLMKQLIAAKRIPTFYLTHNHRILQYSVNEEVDRPSGAPGLEKFDRVALDNANALIDPSRSMDTPISFRQGTGFYEMEGDINVVQSIIMQLAGSGIHHSRVVVLTPYNKHLKDLNSIFQDVYLNDVKSTHGPKGRKWCVGDRVMMTMNNYDINVMNGEEGDVVDIDKKGITVEFKDQKQHIFLYQGTMSDIDNRYHTEEKGEKELTIDQLQHSFAITVHKSQGSQWEFVIFFIPTVIGPGGKLNKFLNINLFYTGITRLEKAIWLVGSPHIISHATCVAQSRRYEGLCARLLEMKDPELEASLELLVAPPVVKAPEPEFDEDDFFSHDDFGSYE